MNIIRLAIMLFPLTLSAETMVFMREFQAQKHIFLKTDTKVEQISSDSSWHLYPGITSDATKVVWVAGESERSLALEIFDLNQKTIQKIKHPYSGLILHPRFSGNNEWLFYSAPNVNNSSKIFFTKINESSAPIEINLSGVHYFPRPSSDGSFIVLQKNLNNKKEIVIYNRFSQQFEVVAEGMSPQLSMDERYIAFTQKNNGFWGIKLYDRFQKEFFTITQPQNFDDMAPTFDPQGKLVFSSNINGRFQIYRLNNGEREPVITSEADDYAPHFSGESQWTQKQLPSVPAPARSSFASLNYQGKIYISGGHQGPEHTYPEDSFCDEFQVFDINTSTWKNLSPRPHKAHGYQMAGFGKYIYAFGGFAFSSKHKPKWKSLDFIDRYDIEKNEWTTIGKLPRARSSNVVALIDEKVFIIGGWDSTPKFENDLDGTFHSEVDVFNLKTESVEESHFNLPSPLRRAFTASVHDNKIYLIGGLGIGASHFELLANITVIDPITGFSSELNPLPFATFAPAAEFLGNELFVFGGMFKMGEMNYDYVSHVYSYNLDNNSWKHLGRYLKETKGFSQVVPLDSKTLGILGGHHYEGEMDSPVPTFESFGKN